MTTYYLSIAMGDGYEPQDAIGYPGSCILTTDKAEALAHRGDGVVVFEINTEKMTAERVKE